MKKLIILLLTVSAFLTGCSAISYTNNIDDVLNTSMNNKNKLYNTYFDGYKYYVPKGLKFISKDDYNSILIDRYHNKYYLYVDLISYFNNTEIKYKENDEFYYKKINYKKKDGYVEVQEMDDKYFVQFTYNYAKIEVYCSKDNLGEVVYNSSEMLKSIKYNKKIIGSLIGDNKLDYKEESFNIFKSKSNKDNFLNYEKTYDSKEESDVNKIDVEDEDQIDLDNDSES